MCPIRVAVNGALGKVGREMVKAAAADSQTNLVGAADTKASSATLIEGSLSVPLSTDLGKIVDTISPEVIIDFTLAKPSMAAVRLCLPRKINMVIGTTGFSADEVTEMGQLADTHGVGVILASNFSIGAVMMMHLARIAAKYFDYAEIIELHHNQKLDAPSGTSLSTAKGMAKSRGKPFLIPPGPNRGEMIDGITLHSLRLPGLMAHQEVLFGAAGQTLSIRHDTINRECYAPGVMLAVKEVVKRKGLIQGLDVLLGL